MERHNMEPHDSKPSPPAGRPPDSIPGGFDPAAEDQQHLATLKHQRRERLTRSIIVLVLLVILILFVTTNAERVRVSFIFFHANVPLIWVMLICAVIGAIIGYVIGRPGRHTRLHKAQSQQPKRPA